MTDPNEPAKVEQRHRDAAASYGLMVGRYTKRDADNVLAGDWDFTTDVAFFARLEASLRTPTPEQDGEVGRLRLALGSAFETLIYIFECSDDQHVSKAAKAASDEIDAALRARAAEAGE